METGTGNPNTGRPGYGDSITVQYKSNDMGLALMEADEDLQGGAAEVLFALGKLVLSGGAGSALAYKKGDEVKAYLPVKELRELHVSLYGPIADWNVRQVGGFIGRKTIVEFEKQGLLGDLDGWKQPIKGKLGPTSWWRQSGYMSNG